MALAALNSDLAETGFAVIPNVLPSSEIDSIGRRIAELCTQSAGMRRLIDIPWCRDLAEHIAGDERLRPVLPVCAVPAQCTLFVKSIAKNWLVSLHQDLSIPVARRVESSRCSGWSKKEGYLFVQPPISFLEQMLAIRVHLDECDERTGALRVVPGSHRLGRLGSDEALRARDEWGEVHVNVPRGGVMLMRPLLLHASSKTSLDTIRQVLHFVFGPSQLPEGLRWPSSRSAVGES